MPIPQDLLERIKKDDPTLCYLNLSGQGLTDDDVVLLSEALKSNTHLIAISLHQVKMRMPQEPDGNIFYRYEDTPIRLHNKLTARSAKLFASCKVLRWLDISGNSIRDEGAIALAQSKSLIYLCADNCQITIEGANAFLANLILQDLWLRWNQFVPDINDWATKIDQRLEDNKATVDEKYRLQLSRDRTYAALEKQILVAIDVGNIEQLRNLIPKLEHGINTRLDYGCGILQYAIDQKKLNVIRWLLTSGALIEVHEREYTPLYKAAENGEYEIVKLLLCHGSNLTGEFYFNNETALSIAAFKFCEVFIGYINTFQLPPNREIPSFSRDALFSYQKRIIAYWNRIRIIPFQKPIWQLFASENLSCNFAGDCLNFLKYIKKFRLINHLHVNLIEVNRRAAVYELILNKFKIVHQKATSREEDELASDDEDSLIHVYRIQPLAKATSAKQFSKAELESYIQQLNRELKNTTEALIDWSKYPKFFIAQYRGIHYYRNHFSKQQRADHRQTTHLHRIAPAPAVYHMSGLTPVQHQMARETVIKKHRAVVEEVFDKLESNIQAKQFWGRKDKVFRNQGDMYQQRMSNSYSEYKNDLLKHKEVGARLLSEKDIIGYPHYATSDLPFHALKYAYGQKKVAGLTEWRLRPMFQQSGKPLHPYPGKIFISLFTPLQMYLHKTRHVAGMHNRKYIFLKGTVAPERETSIPGGLEPDIPFYEELLRIPSFEKYSDEYKKQYGFSLEEFECCRREIVDSWTNSNLEKRNKIRKKVKNKIIEKIIMIAKEKQLLQLAQDEANRLGGYLIYRHFNGQYGFEPEGMRIPSKGKKHYTEREKDLLKEMGDQRFNGVLQQKPPCKKRKPELNNVTDNDRLRMEVKQLPPENSLEFSAYTLLSHALIFLRVAISAFIKVKDIQFFEKQIKFSRTKIKQALSLQPDWKELKQILEDFVTISNPRNSNGSVSRNGSLPSSKVHSSPFIPALPDMPSRPAYLDGKGDKANPGDPAEKHYEGAIYYYYDYFEIKGSTLNWTVAESKARNLRNGLHAIRETQRIDPTYKVKSVAALHYAILVTALRFELEEVQLMQHEYAHIFETKSESGLTSTIASNSSSSLFTVATDSLSSSSSNNPVGAKSESNVKGKQPIVVPVFTDNIEKIKQGLKQHLHYLCECYECGSREEWLKAYYSYIKILKDILVKQSIYPANECYVPNYAELKPLIDFIQQHRSDSTNESLSLTRTALCVLFHTIAEGYVFNSSLKPLERLKHFLTWRRIIKCLIKYFDWNKDLVKIVIEDLTPNLEAVDAQKSSSKSIAYQCNKLLQEINESALDTHFEFNGEEKESVDQDVSTVSNQSQPVTASVRVSGSPVPSGSTTSSSASAITVDSSSAALLVEKAAQANAVRKTLQSGAAVAFPASSPFTSLSPAASVMPTEPRSKRKRRRRSVADSISSASDGTVGSSGASTSSQLLGKQAKSSQSGAVVAFPEPLPSASLPPTTAVMPIEPRNKHKKRRGPPAAVANASTAPLPFPATVAAAPFTAAHMIKSAASSTAATEAAISPFVTSRAVIPSPPTSEDFSIPGNHARNGGFAAAMAALGSGGGNLTASTVATGSAMPTSSSPSNISAVTAGSSSASASFQSLAHGLVAAAHANRYSQQGVVAARAPALASSIATSSSTVFSGRRTAASSSSSSGSSSAATVAAANASVASSSSTILITSRISHPSHTDATASLLPTTVVIQTSSSAPQSMYKKGRGSRAAHLSASSPVVSPAASLSSSLTTHTSPSGRLAPR